MILRWSVGGWRIRLMGMLRLCEVLHGEEQVGGETGIEPGRWVVMRPAN